MTGEKHYIELIDKVISGESSKEELLELIESNIKIFEDRYNDVVKERDDYIARYKSLLEEVMSAQKRHEDTFGK